MTCDIDLNPTSGIPDIVKIFIVYRLKQNSISPKADNPPRNSNGLRHGLFGHDNGGYDKFVAFKDLTRGNLIISGTIDRYVNFGPNL